MAEKEIFPVPESFKKNTHVTKDIYEDLYRKAQNDPVNVLGMKLVNALIGLKPYHKNKRRNVGLKNNVDINWYYDGTLNVSENCIDRHLKNRADQTAIIWEGDDPSESLNITYKELYKNVCRFANALKNNGVSKGDRVTLYMPMIPEAAYAMLACSRIGAVHSVVFGGFSPEALAGRILDCDSHYVITADEGIRGGKTIPLKKNTDEALKNVLM